MSIPPFVATWQISAHILKKVSCSQPVVRTEKFAHQETMTSQWRSVSCQGTIINQYQNKRLREIRLNVPMILRSEDPLTVKSSPVTSWSCRQKATRTLDTFFTHSQIELSCSPIKSYGQSKFKNEALWYVGEAWTLTFFLGASILNKQLVRKHFPKLWLTDTLLNSLV